MMENCIHCNSKVALSKLRSHALVCRWERYVNAHNYQNVIVTCVFHLLYSHYWCPVKIVTPGPPFILGTK